MLMMSKTKVFAAGWRRVMTLCAALIAQAPNMAQAIPAWAKIQGQSLSGSQYKAVCSGQGPSVDIARSEAVQSCKASASGQLQRDGRVNALSIETERDISYYQEVSESVSYRGLACIPEREEIEDLGDGSYKLWVLCKFDLSKAEIGNAEATEKPRTPSTSSTTPSLSNLKEHSFAIPSGNKTSRSHVVVNFAVVPGCTKVLVRGARPRTITCTSNVVALAVEEGDDEAIVTRSGYISKRLNLRERAWRNNETVQVILEAH